MIPYVNCSSPEFSLPHQDFPVESIRPNLCNKIYPETLFDPKDANLTEDQLRDKYLGPQRSNFFVPVCVIYLLIFVVGAVGNTLTCIVILRHRFMRTPTNYYLFSLAVSDLLVLLLGMPLELYDLWSNYPFLLGASGCYFKTLLFEAVCFASILNVTALSVERYIAVVHPLKAKYVVTRNHAKRVIIVIWVLSVICSIPNTSLHGLQPLYVPGRGWVPDSEVCTLVKPRLTYNLIIQITTVVFFFLPMGIISILYLLIGLQLKKERMLEALGAKSGSSCDSHHAQEKKKFKRRQVTKMLCESDAGESDAWDGQSQRVSPKAVLGGCGQENEVQAVQRFWFIPEKGCGADSRGVEAKTGRVSWPQCWRLFIQLPHGHKTSPPPGKFWVRKRKELGWDGGTCLLSPTQMSCAVGGGGISQRGSSSYPALQPLRLP
ncbi:neuromedin-U receptor 1 isoform X1 [Cuculus canorus]|uniref:neuromedin-U receptor 1 isoform X1 n=1 Tax=Cuculus canorus TaxID=55661 RepID=UPI0023AB14A6|nr:neuromedin-U receptor 1 isoform X1 [Cuculus canorus]XP_053930075.1 neuromedin-U receptor 1 isoform X1 [Cuculus canorus]XP_053930076.1 neuromedin-U receptor 1 isoform X1 [Cuculus canorus]